MIWLIYFLPSVGMEFFKYRLDQFSEGYRHKFSTPESSGLKILHCLYRLKWLCTVKRGLCSWWRESLLLTTVEAAAATALRTGRRKQKWGPCGLKTAGESLERKELEKEVNLRRLHDVWLYVRSCSRPGLPAEPCLELTHGRIAKTLTAELKWRRQ